MTKRQAKISDEFEKSLSAFSEKWVEKVRAQAERDLKEWQRKHPRREINLRDGMGALDIRVDGRDVDFDFDERCKPILEPLVQVKEWCTEFSDRLKWCIPEIYLPPLAQKGTKK